MGADFHQRLRDAFADIAKQNSDRCVLINVNRPIDIVSAHIWQIVADRFGIS
jgi:dTMP kinase